MSTVGQLLNEKGHEIWSIHPNKNIGDAMKMMVERDIGSLLVIDNARLLGIVTERQCARCVAFEKETSADVKVSEIMEPSVPSVGLNDSIEECMALMTKRRVRYLPVLTERSPIGIVSIGDLVKSIIGHQQVIIVQLEQYIQGRVANG